MRKLTKAQRKRARYDFFMANDPQAIAKQQQVSRGMTKIFNLLARFDPKA